jgi:hypothetical protein
MSFRVPDQVRDDGRVIYCSFFVGAASSRDECCGRKKSIAAGSRSHIFLTNAGSKIYSCSSQRDIAEFFHNAKDLI